MKYLSALVFVCLLASGSAVASPAPGDSETSAQDQARFDLLKKRFLQQQGIAAPATGAVAPVTPGAPPVPVAAEPTRSWEEQERERSTEFNAQFGAGAYEGIIGFSKRCVSADGCDKLATADVIGGAYKFVDLQKDVAKKTVAPDSDAYRSRHSEIKGGMRAALEEFRPRAGGRTSYESDFIKFSDPIVKKIFTKDELLQYAERNAASADSPTFYNYLGQTLNGSGPPAKAKAAFDAALQKDPKNEAALSGRAESRLRLGDYPGAVQDARQALALDPQDKHALLIMKFAEGRAPGVALPRASFEGLGDPGAGGSGPSGIGAGRAAGDGSGAAALSPARAESERRSSALVVDARRLLTLGDARAAVAMLSKAAELNPRNAEALALAAMAQIRLKNYPEALAAAEAGLRLAPNTASLLDAKANALNRMGDYRGALASADLAIAANPSDPIAHYNRAWALSGLHRREEALASLKTAAQLSPQFAPTLANAMSLPQEGDLMFLFPTEASPEPYAPAPPPAAAGLPAWTGNAALAVLALALALAAGVVLGRKRSLPPPLAERRSFPGLLDGKYELGREIGAGGMGVVYAGRDLSLDRPVAVKRMREEFRWDARERARFVTEAKLVAKLKHPHIVGIHAIVEHEKEVYLVFEYIPGRTLHELSQGLPPSFEKSRDLFRGVAAALDYAHGLGVIHRDLKPSNLMVDDAGRIRVMDFGIARLTEEALSRRSKTNTVIGTPLYMAPEQEQGVIRKESDVYSMAVCLYEVLTGRPPFNGSAAGLLMNKIKKNYEPASKLAPALPAGLDEIFAKALDPDPDRRYSTATRLMRDLESLESRRG